MNSANGYTGTYDGAGHQIKVTAPSGATITYGTDGESYSSTNPAFTDAGSYTVYYKVSKTGYEDYTATASAIDNNNYKLPANVTTVWSVLKGL